MPGEALLNYWGVRKVMTSDIDFNQHTNNAKFIWNGPVTAYLPMS
jgi:acyl-ACP thioesterase